MSKRSDHMRAYEVAKQLLSLSRRAPGYLITDYSERRIAALRLQAYVTLYSDPSVSVATRVRGDLGITKPDMEEGMELLHTICTAAYVSAMKILNYEPFSLWYLDKRHAENVLRQLEL